MLPLGQTRYIDFRLVDIANAPVPGRTLSAWATSPNQLLLLRNTAACADPLSLLDYGDGRYTVTYTPSAPGHDYFLMYDQPTDIRIVDTEDVLPADFAVGPATPVIQLDHNYGGADALRLTGVDTPSLFTILVFRSTDWDQNRRIDADAMGMTALDGNGRWLQKIPVSAGTYHIVARSFRQLLLLKVYLGVA